MGKAGWIKEKIYTQRFSGVSLPILSFRTKKKGDSIWLISGIHGEEPAGVNAIAENVEFLINLGRRFPIVLLPLCNPKGYLLNQRYPTKGRSVGSSGFLLLTEGLKRRATRFETKDAFSLTRKVLKLAKGYPPAFALDFHEDRSHTDPYIYCHSRLGADDPIAKEVVKILRRNKMPLQMRGMTKFHERIVNGIVVNTSDGSIDELITSKEVVLNGKRIKGPGAKSVIVIETRTIGMPLAKRVKAHSAIIRAIPKFVRLSR